MFRTLAKSTRPTLIKILSVRIVNFIINPHIEDAIRDMYMFLSNFWRALELKHLYLVASH